MVHSGQELLARYRIRTGVHSEQELLARYRIRTEVHSAQWYTVGKNCGHGRIRTGVNSGQELLARQDQNLGTQWARIVGKV